MREHKYIIFSDSMSDFPIVFPKTLIHKDVGRAMVRTGGMFDLEPVSAGFVVYNSKEEKWEAYGRSESLNLDSRPNDGIIITEFLTN